MKVEWADKARADFDRAIAYMLRRSRSGALSVGARIIENVALLEYSPELAPPSRHRGLRQMVVTGTPYLVVYRVLADRVEIRAIIHVKRKRRR